MGKTQTYTFGVSKREAHDSTIFYSRELFKGLESPMEILNYITKNIHLRENNNNINALPCVEWVDKIYCQSSENMFQIPNESIALAFTSPPYNSGKEYDKDLRLEEYLLLLAKVGKEVFRVLKKGGRYVINIANLGRKPYIPLHSFIYITHMEIGFKPAGEIIWQKSKGARGNCAWGSWLSAKSPRIRDIHEYLLVFVKEDFSRPDKGISTLEKEEFLDYTLSVWEVPPESAKKVGHPAPFPVELASRVIKLFTYKNDVVLDPFVGSGTTCVAAKKLGRHYVGYDISEEYCKIALKRLNEEGQTNE
ncbi:DNA-methyltransferase [Thermoanaerobacter sp. RKWS2]|uniref:DNA-methyltransferase n=1 Tax=Thermoanaerobacter sp. RKWS2 TaxID=2983842 RepID=UPI00175D70EC|nr:site-specific DNA-methyltransferase [Thermoanaerobacter sp. RKWS2]UZQ81778.1 site-specific DNA-methyltransferase [Thermoanaerobacter sp. RKWS2]HHY80208.1 site-specific DNA-methyltransferase [Thermoanaerobacter sp.]